VTSHEVLVGECEGGRGGGREARARLVKDEEDEGEREP
jgi:hypothetical protein